MRRLLVVSILSLSVVSHAQVRPFGDAHAIVGARIEIGDGRVIEKGTVLIRDGLIEAVGADVKVPADAEVLKGDGLIVFPGFIDAWTTKGLKLPAWNPVQDAPPDTSAEAAPSMREANRKWVRPELRAVEHYSLSESEAAPLRKAGFTAILAAPSGGLINGAAMLISLSDRPKREAVLRDPVGASLSCRMPAGVSFFDSSPSYPGTPLGIFAHIRQALLDAEWYRQLRESQRAGGPRRPPSDDVLAALQSILGGEVPSLIEAETPNDVIRAIELADEFRLKPVIVGGLEAHKHAAMLAKKNISVLVGLKFPTEPKLPGEKGKADEGKGDEGKGETKPDGARPEEKKEPAEEPDADMPLAERRERKRLWQEKAANARTLQKAGVSIAFTTRGTKDTAEFWTNLRRIIKDGLPREAALKALTIEPARIFGMERQIGTVEAGKIANLTLMTADFADEKSKTRYLFVDGRKFDTEIEPPAARPLGSPMGDLQAERVAR